MFARSTAIFRQPTIFRAAIRAQSTAAGVDATRGPLNPPQQQKGELVTREQAEHRESGLTTSAPSVEIVAADVLNDAPPALHYRTVRIYTPTKTTMQSGKQGNGHWRIDFDTLEGGGRWENALMGWGSSADYMQGATMKFKTREDAIHFAEKQGWNYHVDKEHKERIPPKSYAENFVHIPGKLRRHQTK